MSSFILTVFHTKSSNLSDDGATLYDPWGNKVSVVGSGSKIEVTLSNLPNKTKICPALKTSYPYGDAGGNCEANGTFVLDYPNSTV